MKTDTEVPFTSHLMIKALHERLYPSWIFDGHSLIIIDANQSAKNFCLYDNNDLIGLSITELWHGEDLKELLEDLDIHSSARSFFGNLKHKKKNGEIVVMRVRATRQLNPKSCWEVHLI
jgi:PAS domain S-box-containing protein